MKVRFICGYYSDLAHKKKERRPEDYWDAYNFCWGVKVGKFKHQFNIHGLGKKTPITKSNFALARDTFGEWIEKSVPVLGGGSDAILVPVPSKDDVIGAANFRTLEMTKEALDGTRLARLIVDGLHWKASLTKAHQGGTRNRILFGQRLVADPKVKDKKVILIDDVITTGSSLLAAADVLKQQGATVLGAIVCGKTIYDLNTPHFGES
jgi:phosphoribosylpyrophosphate synthetase